MTSSIDNLVNHARSIGRQVNARNDTNRDSGSNEPFIGSNSNAPDPNPNVPTPNNERYLTIAARIPEAFDLSVHPPHLGNRIKQCHACRSLFHIHQVVYSKSTGNYLCIQCSPNYAVSNPHRFTRIDVITNPSELYAVQPQVGLRNLYIWMNIPVVWDIANNAWRFDLTEREQLQHMHSEPRVPGGGIPPRWWPYLKRGKVLEGLINVPVQEMDDCWGAIPKEVFDFIVTIVEDAHQPVPESMYDVQRLVRCVKRLKRGSTGEIRRLEELVDRGFVHPIIRTGLDALRRETRVTGLTNPLKLKYFKGYYKFLRWGPRKHQKH